MCLYPKLIKNPKYKPNKKNKGIVPECTDKRTLWVPVGCQKCMECQRQRARGWSIRLQQEIQQHKKTGKHFVTLTFSNESIKELAKETNEEGYERDNAIATLATRRFLERWRAKYGKSIKHWLVTELGHNGTENIHLHGIIFTENKEDIANVWKYGYVWVGDYVNEATINYVIKYCTKTDLKHSQYRPKILTSPGIGAQYTLTPNGRQHKYIDGNTQELYRTREGYKMALPTYYRNKIYTEEQREKLWIEKIDKQERWVDGSRVSIKDGDQTYYQTLKWARLKNQRLGYGDDSKNWNQQQYENERRNMLHEERTNTDRNNTPTLATKKLDRHRKMDTDKQLEQTRKWIQQMANRQ